MLACSGHWSRQKSATLVVVCCKRRAGDQQEVEVFRSEDVDGGDERGWGASSDDGDASGTLEQWRR